MDVVARGPAASRSDAMTLGTGFKLRITHERKSVA